MVYEKRKFIKIQTKFVQYLKRIVKSKDFLKNIKNAGLYLSGSVIQAVLAIVAQPIYSIYLSADDFGIIGYFNAIQNILSPIFIFSMTSVYLMNYFKQSEEDNKKLLFNITFFLCSFNTLLVLINYAGMFYYFNYMKVKIPLNPFAMYILLALLLNNIKSVILINYRIRKKAFSFFLFSTANSVLNFGLGLFFVAYLRWGAQGRMLAPVISTVSLLPICIYVLWKYTTFNINYKLIKSAVKVAFPLVLASYAYVPINNIDRIFLERLNNLSELGLYNIGVTIAGYVQIGYIALGLTFEPDIFKSIADNDHKKLFLVGAVIFLPYLLAILLFLTFSHTIISVLTAGRYIGAAKFSNILIISVFLMGVFSFFDKIFVALGETKLNLYVNIVGGISAIVIMYFASTNFQFMGAAVGKVFVAIIMVIISSILAYKHLQKGKVQIE